MSQWQEFIRLKAGERKIKWTRYALGAIGVEPATVHDVEVALQEATVLEEYPVLHRYLPDCLVLTFTHSGQPFPCVVACNQPADMILIVTVYQPNRQEWEDDWRTRK